MKFKANQIKKTCAAPATTASPRPRRRPTPTVHRPCRKWRRRPRLCLERRCAAWRTRCRRVSRRGRRRRRRFRPRPAAAASVRDRRRATASWRRRVWRRTSSTSRPDRLTKSSKIPAPARRRRRRRRRPPSTGRWPRTSWRRRAIVSIASGAPNSFLRFPFLVFSLVFISVFVFFVAHQISHPNPIRIPSGRLPDRRFESDSPWNQVSTLPVFPLFLSFTISLSLSFTFQVVTIVLFQTPDKRKHYPLDDKPIPLNSNVPSQTGHPKKR